MSFAWSLHQTSGPMRSIARCRQFVSKPTQSDPNNYRLTTSYILDGHLSLLVYCHHSGNLTRHLRGKQVLDIGLVGRKTWLPKTFSCILQLMVAFSHRRTGCHEQGATTDSQTVSFTSSETQYNSEPIESTITGSPPPPTSAASVTLTCAAKCGTSMDIICYARYKCWKLLGSFLGLIGGLAAAGECSFCLESAILAQ